MPCKPLMLTLMTMCCACAVTACAPRVRHVVLTPPPALLTPCPRPEVPEAMMHGNIRDYAFNSTRYIIDLEESLDTCDGKLAGLRDWQARMEGEHGSASHD